MTATATATRYHQSADGNWKPCTAQDESRCPLGSAPGGLGHIDRDTAVRFNQKREELRQFEQEVADLFGDKGMQKIMRTNISAPVPVPVDANPYVPHHYLTPDQDLIDKTVTTQHQFREAVKNERGERNLNGVRRVIVEMNKSNWSKGFDAPAIEVKGPANGRPIVVDYRTGYTELEVVEGTAIVNAMNRNGGGVKLRGSAAATIMTPGSKFHVDVNDDAKAIIIPREGAWGTVYVGKDADAVIHTPEGVTHKIEIRRLDRRSV